MKKHERSHDEIAALCLELSLFLHAGVDAGSGLALLMEEETNPGRKELLAGMCRRMDEGCTLAAAFRDAEQFPDYVCSLIQVGEESGRTEEALRSLSQYYEERARLDRRLRSALMYPAVLMLLMLAVIVVLLTQVLPVFNDVYASLGGQLTGLAGGLMSFGMALDSIMPVLCVLLALVVLFLVGFAGSPQFRVRVLGLWRKHQGDKGVSRQLNTARFAQALSMGLSSGLPVEDALSLAGILLEDIPTASARCGKCRELLDGGTPLARALGDSGLLPLSDSRLLELAMRSGAQDTVMPQIAGRLAEEADAALETRMSQIEPTLVVTTSILVGLILLSVMLPLMHIMTAIG